MPKVPKLKVYFNNKPITDGDMYIGFYDRDALIGDVIPKAMVEDKNYFKRVYTKVLQAQRRKISNSNREAPYYDRTTAESMGFDKPASGKEELNTEKAVKGTASDPGQIAKADSGKSDI